MQKIGPGPTKFFVPSLTCYRGWVGWVDYEPSTEFFTHWLWSFPVIRTPDWLSASLRAAIGKTSTRVDILMLSGDTVSLMNAKVGAVGAAVWSDPKHPKPSGPLEMATYFCGQVLIDSAGASPRYDWWKLNA